MLNVLLQSRRSPRKWPKNACQMQRVGHTGGSPQTCLQPGEVRAWFTSHHTSPSCIARSPKAQLPGWILTSQGYHAESAVRERHRLRPNGVGKFRSETHTWRAGELLYAVEMSVGRPFSPHCSLPFVLDPIVIPSICGLLLPQQQSLPLPHWLMVGTCPMCLSVRTINAILLLQKRSRICQTMRCSLDGGLRATSLLQQDG